MGGLKKIPRGQSNYQVVEPESGRMVEMQMCNLVIGVRSRPTRITPATSDRVGARGTKLHERVLLNTSGRPVYASLPVRSHFTTTLVLCKRVSFFCERVRNGGWFAPEKLASQVIGLE
jgi:hypothetical protein